MEQSVSFALHMRLLPGTGISGLRGRGTLLVLPHSDWNTTYCHLVNSYQYLQFVRHINKVNETTLEFKDIFRLETWQNLTNVDMTAYTGGSIIEAYSRVANLIKTNDSSHLSTTTPNYGFFFFVFFLLSHHNHRQILHQIDNY